MLENTLFGDYASNSWVLLAFVGFSMMLKAFASGITLGSGGNGGNFAPSLFLGSYAGYFFSKFLNLTGLTDLPVSNFTLVGMAGILSGLFHAPLTAIFLIAEITGGYDLMIPLMIVASVSFAVSKRFEKHSLDVKNLAKKGNVFTGNKDTNILCTLEIEDLVKKDYLTVESTQNLENVADLLAHSDQVIFGVVNGENDLQGLVYFNDIREVIFDNIKAENILVKDIMVQPIQTADLFDSMQTVMNKFEKSNKAFLPVLKNGKYYGFITKSDVLESYRNRLKSMIFE